MWPGVVEILRPDEIIVRDLQAENSDTTISFAWNAANDNFSLFFL